MGDLSAEGRAPNKKLAKRYAAEKMLEMLGYAKPLPDPPAKPAIKNVTPVRFLAIGISTLIRDYRRKLSNQPFLYSIGQFLWSKMLGILQISGSVQSFFC